MCLMLNIAREVSEQYIRVKGFEAGCYKTPLLSPTRNTQWKAETKSSLRKGCLAVLSSTRS